MDYRLPELYKKLLILAVVFCPIVWLMFTEDGQRRTDTVVLWLFGEDEIKMELRALDTRFTEEELRKVYPDLPWQCQERSTPYGDYLCVSRIGVFNGIPSRYITFFFDAGQLSAVKLHYRENNHNQLLSQLHRQLGQADDEVRASVTAPDPDEILQWHTSYGTVVMKRQLQENEEPSLFWITTNRLGQ